MQGPDGQMIPWQRGQTGVGFTPEDAAAARAAFATTAGETDRFGNPLGQRQVGPQPWMTATDVGGAGMQLGSPEAQAYAQRTEAFRSPMPQPLGTAQARRSELGLGMTREARGRTQQVQRAQQEQARMQAQRQADVGMARDEARLERESRERIAQTGAAVQLGVAGMNLTASEQRADAQQQAQIQRDAQQTAQRWEEFQNKEVFRTRMQDVRARIGTMRDQTTKTGQFVRGVTGVLTGMPDVADKLRSLPPDMQDAARAAINMRAAALADSGQDPEMVAKNIAKEFFEGRFRWRRNLQRGIERVFDLSDEAGE